MTTLVSPETIASARALIKVYGAGRRPCARWTGSTSTSPAARSPPSWARPARASPRSCTAWPASTPPPSGSVVVDGVEISRLSRAAADRSCGAPGSASSSRRTTSCRRSRRAENIRLPLDIARRPVDKRALRRRRRRPSGWRTGCTTGPRSSPAASSSGSRAPVRSSPGRRWSSRTSPPATSTRTVGRRGAGLPARAASTTSATRWSWSRTSPPRPPTPTGCSSSPTGGWRPSCPDPTADSVLAAIGELAPPASAAGCDAAAMLRVALRRSATTSAASCSACWR